MPAQKEQRVRDVEEFFHRLTPQELRDRFGLPGGSTVDWLLERLAHDANRAAFVARVGGRVAGVLDCVRDANEIEFGIVIATEFRRRGIGSITRACWVCCITCVPRERARAAPAGDDGWVGDVAHRIVRARQHPGAGAVARTRIPPASAPGRNGLARGVTRRSPTGAQRARSERAVSGTRFVSGWRNARSTGGGREAGDG